MPFALARLPSASTNNGREKSLRHRGRGPDLSVRVSVKFRARGLRSFSAHRLSDGPPLPGPALRRQGRFGLWRRGVVYGSRTGREFLRRGRLLIGHSVCRWWAWFGLGCLISV